jgi:hypothetical protein
MKTVEESLRAVERLAAMLSHCTNVAASTNEPPDPEALRGPSETCDDIVETTVAVRRSLSIETQGLTVRREGP